jgi:hypothetical protein
VSFIVTAAIIGIPAIWAVLPVRWTLPAEEAAERLAAKVGSALAPLAFWRRGGRTLSFGRSDSDLGVASRTSSMDDKIAKK